MVLAPEPLVDVSDLALSSLASPGDTGKLKPANGRFVPEPLAAVEKRHIIATLESTGGNKSKAAGLLGIERSTLDRKLAPLGRKRPSSRSVRPPQKPEAHAEGIRFALCVNDAHSLGSRLGLGYETTSCLGVTPQKPEAQAEGKRFA